MFFKRLDFQNINWNYLNSFNDRTIHQTKEWLEYLSITQKATPIIAALHDNQNIIGYFTGCIIKKFGIRILGSPFPGWTTSYMGFNLLPGIPREKALNALSVFAFNDLRCLHMEIMDRYLTKEDALKNNFIVTMFGGYEVDLTKSEKELFMSMSSACRRCIRKAEKSGVVIEEANDLTFANDYFFQLQDVFAKQKLIPTYNKNRVIKLIKTIYPSGNLLLLRARDKTKRCIATGIFPGMNDTAYFWGGASWRSDQFVRPNEAIQWYAIRYWKERGIIRYDMGGGGKYKSKYGGQNISIPWIRKSKFNFLSKQRDIIGYLYKILQKYISKIKI